MKESVWNTAIDYLRERIDGERDPWKKRTRCERCPNEPDVLDRETVLFGVLSCRVCRVCRREFDLHPEVERLLTALDAAGTRIRAHTRVGRTDEAEGEVRTVYTVALRDCRQFAATWLSTPRALRPPPPPTTEGDE